VAVLGPMTVRAEPWPRSGCAQAGCVALMVLVLAAFLAPVFDDLFTGKQATGTTCVSNLRQLSLGLRMYVEDYDDTLTSFMRPHGGRSNLAYVDGHVKSVAAPPSAGIGAK
jgi:prepilin-type processing-associated H-X9-DG protein